VSPEANAGSPERVPPAPGFRVARPVRAGQEEIFSFLSSLPNHWTLFEEVRIREGTEAGTTVRWTGPVGIGRTVEAKITSLEEPTRVGCRVTAGPKTRLSVEWEIRSDDGQESGGTSLIEATVAVLAAGRLDRVLLRFGGRSWLRERFKRALQRLPERVHAAAL
jgi:hypothetical protein